jgi:metallophosphoesterase superfamily enzyme
MFSLLLPHAAAVVKYGRYRTLLITDPHIGWEMELQKKGIHVPSQTAKIFTKLETILKEHQPDALTIIGDVKYTVTSSELGEWQDIPEFFKKLQPLVQKISVVRGNHDANLEPLLPENVELLPATGVVIGDVALLGCKTLVMGHMHPVVVFRDPVGCRLTRQVWLHTKIDNDILGRILLKKAGVKIQNSVAETLRAHFRVDLATSELYIMPSFNDFLGGRPINENRPRNEKGGGASIGPVLRSDAVSVENAELYLLDGTFLGTANQLRTL